MTSGERYHSDPEYRESRKNAQRRYYASHKDDPEFQTKNRARVAKWRKENPDKVREASRKESRKEYRRKYYEEHKDKYKTIQSTSEQREARRAAAREKWAIAKRVATDSVYAYRNFTPEQQEYYISFYNKTKEYRKSYYQKYRDKILAANRTRRQDNIDYYRELGRDSYRRTTLRKIKENRNEE